MQGIPQHKTYIYSKCYVGFQHMKDGSSSELNDKTNIWHFPSTSESLIFQFQMVQEYIISLQKKFWDGSWLT